MEYVVVLVFIGAVMAVAMSQLFYTYSPSDEGGARIGPLGKQLQGFYQRTLGGISLPVP